jgi:2-methylisocitrate lyase-like PEP mutase family enzyme
VSAAGAITTSVGVFDALSARLAERAGFDVLFLSGFGVSASLLGQPDFGLLTQSEVLDAARRVVRAVRVPVIVDGDTGHGGVANVQRLVRELVAMGARGVLLEDQVWPKRCGHMAGKAVVPMEEHVAKLRAAAEARGTEPFWILGRTDARATHGLDEAIRRARAYREAGADILFVEAPETREELAKIGRELPGPLIANMVEGGRTPILRPEELRSLGFEWVVYPITALLAAARAMESAYAALRAKGTSEASGPMMAFEELTDLLGLPELRALEERLRS